MSPNCSLVETQNIFFVSEDKIVIDASFEVTALYGEYFTSYLR